MSSRSSLAKPGSDAFQQAVEAVRLQLDQMSVCQAAEHYGCAATTLFNHARGSVKKSGSGRPTVLTDLELEEKVVVRSCVTLGTFGYPPTRDLVGSVIQLYLVQEGRPNAFAASQPSKNWWTGFFKRWPELTERKPEHLTIQRAKCCTPEVVDGYFKKLHGESFEG